MATEDSEDRAKRYADALQTLSRRSEGEVWWSKRYEALKSKGYLLRPRFRPDWQPSWLTNGLPPQLCEDFSMKPPSEIIDATLTQTGRRVAIKRLKNSRLEELRILRFISGEPHKHNSRNHAIELLDAFPDFIDPSYTLVVMPFLRRFDSPPFQTVDEVTEFVSQTLEGLVYMHEVGIAHRDCSDNNIMMDANAMFPKGWHPSRGDLEPDGRTFAEPIPRRMANSLRYYFIDFGISTLYANPNERPWVEGDDGLDQDVPELEWGASYDPYPLDVFILGNVYKRNFLANYKNLSFLQPLIAAMTNKNPLERPTSAVALQTFQKIMRKRFDATLRWRLRPREESFLHGLHMDSKCLNHELRLQLRRVARIFRKPENSQPKSGTTPSQELQHPTSDVPALAETANTQIQSDVNSPHSPVSNSLPTSPHHDPLSPTFASQIPLPPSPASPTTTSFSTTQAHSDSALFAAQIPLPMTPNSLSATFASSSASSPH